MSTLASLVRLHDLDLVLQELRVRPVATRAAASALAEAGTLARARHRLAAGLERRWLAVYERALARYGRGMVAVRGRVCLGCFITLPTSALPAPESPAVCESCGRVLCRI